MPINSEELCLTFLGMGNQKIDQLLTKRECLLESPFVLVFEVTYITVYISRHNNLGVVRHLLKIYIKNSKFKFCDSCFTIFFLTLLSWKTLNSSMKG